MASQALVTNSARGHLVIMRELLATTQLATQLSRRSPRRQFWRCVWVTQTPVLENTQLPRTEDKPNRVPSFLYKPSVRKIKEELSGYSLIQSLKRSPKSSKQNAFIFQNSSKRSQHSGLWEQSWPPIGFFWTQKQGSCLQLLSAGTRKHQRKWSKPHMTRNHLLSVATFFFF